MPQRLGSIQVALQKPSDLQLESCKPLIETALHVVPHLIVVVVIPTNTGVISRITVFKNSHTRATSLLLVGQQLQRCFSIQNVFKITKVKQIHDLIRRQAEEQAPERLFSDLGPQIK